MATVNDGLLAFDLTINYGTEQPTLRSISLVLPAAKITVIAGPNGCGKSTLLSALARLLAPSSGRVELNGTNMQRLSPRQVAQQIAMLPQGAIVPQGWSVRQLVQMGRYPYQSWWRPSTEADAASVEAALQMAGVDYLADRSVDSLSGGERQRVWIAMALAQESDILLLDEPTTYLDMAHQLELMQLIERLNARDGKTIVVVLHDLNQAARLGHHLVLMKDGSVIAEGTPEELMQPETVARVFGVRARIVLDPVYQRPMCIPSEVIGD